MKLYEEYLKEREGVFLYQEEGKGFLTYSLEQHDKDKVIYIQDIYVRPELRKYGLASKMADIVTKKAISLYGCKYLIGSVDVSANGADSSMKVLLAYGMNPYSIDGNIVYFKKELV